MPAPSTPTRRPPFRADHVGSLIRPPEVLDHLRAKQSGKGFSDKAFAKTLKTSVAKVVKQQAAVADAASAKGSKSKKKKK